MLLRHPLLFYWIQLSQAKSVTVIFLSIHLFSFTGYLINSLLKEVISELILIYHFCFNWLHYR